MQEIELKLLLDPALEDLLRRNAKAGLAGAGPVRAQRLLTRYFDTEEGVLRGAGVALRLRREGRRWIQTVKVRAAQTAGLSTALEADAPAPGGRLDLARIPDEAVRARVIGLVDGHALVPVYESEIERTKTILSPGGESRVELCIDRGLLRAGEREEVLREAEFELIEGEPRALFDAARAMLPEGGLVFSELSKAERAAMLAAEGRIVLPVEPRKARPVALARGMPAEEAGVAVLTECLGQIVRNTEAVRAGDNPEGPHQLRVGLRRLRTALRLFREPLDGLRLRRLEAEAKWLGREVGRLRDIDVALVDLVAPAAAAAPEEPGFAPLTDAVMSRAAVIRAELRELLRGPRVQAFLFDLAEFVALRTWRDPGDRGQKARLARPVEALGRERLDRALAKTAKRARGLDGLDIEARHELRKSLKSLRYAVEFFAPVWPKKAVQRMLGPLREMQDLFGHLNDLAMAEALFLAPEAPGAGDPAASRAAGRIIGTRAAEAEADWPGVKGRWKALKAVKPFWR